MFNSGYGNNGDFEALARQYWGAWGDAMRQAGLGAAAPAPAPAPAAAGWQQAMDWWSQLLPSGPSQANDALGRFNQQARNWYGQMQQVAAQFAGRDSSPADVTQAWRQALGGSGANPFPEMFKAMSGKGLHGLDDWIEQAKPFLDSVQRDSERWLNLPAFGQHREHQERLQALTRAQLDYQQRSEAFNRLMGTCAQRAFDVFESKLAAREEPGRQISSARGLFDLWIDAAEEAYAEIALSIEFRQLSGALTNAQMRLRAAIQKEVELLGAQFGMPTRTEVDSAHRKIAELERSLRRSAAAAERAAGAVSGASRPSAARTGTAAAADEAPLPVAASPTRRRRSASTAAVARQPGKDRRRTSARKVAAKTTAPRKAATRKRAPAPATVEEKRVPAARSAKPGASAGKGRAVTKAPAARKAAPGRQATPAKKAAPSKATSAKKTAPLKKAAPSRKAVPSRKAAPSSKAVPAKKATKKSSAASAASSAKGGMGKQSPSMKDWVARNSASPDGGGGTGSRRTSTGNKGARK